MKQRIAAILLAASMYAGIASAARIFVTVAPPPPVHVGVVGVAPGPGYVWTNGYHEWAGGRYIWHEGVWARPPYARAHWVDHRWVSRRGGYEYAPGHWARR